METGLFSVLAGPGGRGPIAAPDPVEPRGGRRSSPRRQGRDARVLRRLRSLPAARKSAPAPVPAAATREPRDAAGPLPQLVLLCTGASRCGAPAVGGGRFKPGCLARAEAALPSARPPGRPPSLPSCCRLTRRGPSKLREPLCSFFAGLLVT